MNSSAVHHADVAVIGAGAVGASIAAELARAGADVLVVERGPGWAAGCSWGNAGLLVPSHAGPFATRADLTQALRWLLRPDSPLGIRPSPRLAPFLTRLLAHTSPTTAHRVLEVSRLMCQQALLMHEALAASGIDTGFARRGLLDVYETPEGLQRGARAAVVHADHGIATRVVDAGEVAELEPAVAAGISGGVLFPDEAHCDPLRFVQAVGGLAQSRGARLLADAEVLALDDVPGGTELTTTAGVVRARTVVLAAGAWSGRLADAVGRPVPMEGGKGYTVDVAAEGRPALTRPLMLQESRVAVTPLDGRLRFAGTMQFTGLDVSLDRRRIDGVQGAGRRLLPGWQDAPVVSLWAGLRPCSPDGLPYVGWLDATRRVVVATGHAMLGLTLAPLAGAQVAALIRGDEIEHAADLDPHRFRRANVPGPAGRRPPAAVP